MIETVDVTINDKKYKYSKDVTLLEIYKEHQTEFKYPIILARVNNRLNELSSKIKEDSIVEFIDLTSPEGNRAHVNGLVFMLLYAVKKLYGKTANITVQHSLDKGIYIQTSFKLTEEKLEKIKILMKEIVKKDLPITKVTIDRIEAMKYFIEIGNQTKADTLKYNTDKVYENISPSFNINYKIKNKFIINNPLNVKFKNKKDIQKKIASSKEVYDLYNLSKKEKEIIMNNLNIYNRTHIKNSNDKNALSLNWMRDKENLKRLSMDTNNFFRNKVKTKSKFNRWTTYEGYEDYLKGKNYTKGLVHKGELLDKFNDCESYAYLRNDFPSDLEKRNDDIDVDFYSIYYLVSVVVYITLDLNKHLNLYLPSIRVYKIFNEWLNNC